MSRTRKKPKPRTRRRHRKRKFKVRTTVKRGLKATGRGLRKGAKLTTKKLKTRTATPIVELTGSFRQAK